MEYGGKTDIINLIKYLIHQEMTDEGFKGEQRVIIHRHAK